MHTFLSACNKHVFDGRKEAIRGIIWQCLKGNNGHTLYLLNTIIVLPFELNLQGSHTNKNKILHRETNATTGVRHSRLMLTSSFYSQTSLIRTRLYAAKFVRMVNIRINGIPELVNFALFWPVAEFYLK